MGYKINGIYIGNHKVRPSGGGWKPGANTIAYYPLTADTTTNDMKGSGTAYNLSTYGSPEFGTYGGVSCVRLKSSGQGLLTGNIATIPLGANPRTILFWVYRTNSTSTGDVMFFGGTESTNKMFFINSSSSGYIFDPHGGPSIYGTPVLRNAWQHIAVSYTGTSATIYVSGVAGETKSYTLNTTGTGICLGGSTGNSGWRNFNGYMSNFIIEDKARTAQEIADYYNQTKGNYGL